VIARAQEGTQVQAVRIRRNSHRRAAGAWAGRSFC
jgi:hypothetical protein